MITTIACSIGKHNLCSGEGNADNDKTFVCDCPCHDQHADDDDFAVEAKKEEDD